MEVSYIIHFFGGDFLFESGFFPLLVHRETRIFMNHVGQQFIIHDNHGMIIESELKLLLVSF